MKTTTINRTGVIDKKYEQKDTRPLRFNAAALQHVREVLTGMYGNAQVAVFRETLTNALDAQIAAGNTTDAVKVTLPSEKNGWLLTIQDFGVGMCRDVIDEKYSDYGGSSKRDSNDEHGGFGMGAKAALALASSFEVETNQDGVKTIFHMGSIDAEDESGVFSLTFDSETATTDPNGTIVRIPYPERSSISASHQSDEFKALMRGMKPGLVEVDGNFWVDTVFNTDTFHSIIGLDGEADIWYPKNPKLMGYDYASEQSSFNIVLGSVPYKIPYSKVLNNLPGDREDYVDVLDNFASLTTRVSMEGMHIYARVPIGVIKPIPNREDIAYTPQAVETILNVAVETQKRIVSDLMEKVHVFDEPREVVKFVTAWEEYLSEVEITWRGEIMPTTFGNPEKGEFPILKIRKPQIRGEIFQVTTVNPSTRKPYKFGSPRTFGSTRDNTVVVTYGKNTTQDTVWNVAEKIRKRWNTFSNLNNNDVAEILIVPARISDNHWWNWQTEFNSKWETAEDIYEDILSYSRRQRVAKVATGVTKPDFVYKLVTYIPTSVEGKPAYLVAENIDADDSRLDKKILYMNENEGFIYSHNTNVPVTRNREFWELYAEKFADTHTILFMNTRQRLDTFLRKFPEAQKLKDVVKNEILNRTPKTVTLSLTDILSHFGYPDRTIMDTLAKTYAVLRERDLIKQNIKLEKATDVWVNTSRSPEISDEEILFRENAWHEYRAMVVKQSTPIAEMIQKMIEKYRFFGQVAGLGKALDEDNLPGIVALYRKVK